MPRRTNLFQEVVALIHGHMARGATVGESALFTNRVKGEDREVDVAIRSKVGGHEVVVAVEARATQRRADVGWVEGMLGKHETLPSDKLVLVSQAGFTKQARALAEARGAVALEPSDLTGEDPAGQIVNRLKSIWPKIVSLTPERAQVTVERSDGEKWFKAPADLWLFLADETQLCTLIEFVQGSIRASWDKIMEDIGLRDIPETIDRFFDLEIGNPSLSIEGNRVLLFARDELAEGGPQLHRIVRVRVVGKAHIDVIEVSLTHHRLGDVIFSQGSATIGRQRALIVATEHEEGGALSLRLTDGVSELDDEP